MNAIAEEWRQSSPLVIYSLLPHENKMCIQNIVIKKHPSCTVPIPSKSKVRRGLIGEIRDGIDMVLSDNHSLLSVNRLICSCCSTLDSVVSKWSQSSPSTRMETNSRFD